MNTKTLFEILVREHARMLDAYIRSAVTDRSTADDIWQETMLTAWRRMDDFDRTKAFGPWLRGIAMRTILASRRKSARYIFLDDEASLEYLCERIDQVQSLSGDTLDEKLRALRDCVELLPEQERTCVKLRYVEELKPAELSVRLVQGLETIKKRLFRAKQRLLDCFEKKMKGAIES